MCALIIYLSVRTGCSAAETDIAWYEGDGDHSQDPSHGFQLEEFRTEYQEPFIPDYEADCQNVSKVLYFIAKTSYS